MPLLPENLTMTQPKDMTLFTSSVLQKASHPKLGIQIKIAMKRKIMSEMMTTYFPSLLLMMTTYANTFFKSFFFEAALATMLAMTTIFIAVAVASLTKPSSYTTWSKTWSKACRLHYEVSHPVK